MIVDVVVVVVDDPVNPITSDIETVMVAIIIAIPMILDFFDIPIITYNHYDFDNYKDLNNAKIHKKYLGKVSPYIPQSFKLIQKVHVKVCIAIGGLYINLTGLS